MRPTVGVLGSGSEACEACAPVGRLIASLGCDLLTGGGGGAMEAVSRAFAETPERRGLVIGILPGAVGDLAALERRDRSATPAYALRSNYPNRWVEVAIYTHLPDSGLDGTRQSSRNHINVLSADALVALPGGEGTYSEMWLAVRYGVPAVAFGAHLRLPDGLPAAGSLDDLAGFLRRHVAVP